MPEFIDLAREGAVIGFTLNFVKELVKTLGVEELLELIVEDIHLMLEIVVAITSAIDSVNNSLTSFHIRWLCTPVKLILEIVLDIIL